MAVSIYQINKGINKSIEFKGLKAQYIWYLAGGILALLILFTCMYLAGVNSYICVAVILVSGSGLVYKVYGLSRKYGEHGMMKAVARKRVPRVLLLRSRIMFMQKEIKSK